jgi:tRNA dimethylallyltransferase
VENQIIVVAGPTATGKTQLSLKLGQYLNAEIVNFDSLCFYKQLNIGTAKPSTEEMNLIPHHLFNISSANEHINAGQYAKIAIDAIHSIHSKNKKVILVGGSGFYLQALLYGTFDNLNSTDLETQNKSNSLYEKEGILPFLNILEEVDPKRLSELHENDHYRVRRAVEYFWMTGKKFSQIKDSHTQVLQNSNWEITPLYVDIEKQKHFDIIQNRTKQMFHNGLKDEAQKLLESGFTGEEKPLKSIGYKQVFQLLNGQISDQESCETQINIATRQLAKAQRTWFKSKPFKACLDGLQDSKTNLEIALGVIEANA